MLHKTCIDFDMLVSSATLPQLYQEGRVQDKSNSWENYSVGYTYLLLKDEASSGQLQEVLDDLAKLKYMDSQRLAGTQLLIRSINDITPGRFVGNPITLRLQSEAYYVLIALALVIIFSA